MSFFSFQDVICCTTGILVLITLLLTLELVKRPDQSGQNHAVTQADITTLASDLRSLTKRRSELEALVLQTQQMFQNLTPSMPVTVEMVEQVRKQVRAMRKSTIQQANQASAVQEEHRKLARQVAVAKSAQGKLNSEIMEIERLLSQELSRPQVTLLGGKASTKKPLLVECSLKEIRVGEVLPSKEMLQIAHFRGPKPIEAFLRWASARSNDSEYFVLLVRPEFAQEFDRLAAKLKQSGFELGWDVWPLSRTLFNEP